MVQPPNGPRDKNSGSGTHRSRSGLGMAGGFLLGIIGGVLMLLNYSNDPGMFNFGVVMFLVGLVVLGISSLRRDRRDHRQNGNSRA